MDKAQPSLPGDNRLLGHFVMQEYRAQRTT